MKRLLLILAILYSTATFSQDKIDLLFRSEKILAEGDTTRALDAFKEILRIYPQSFSAALRLSEVNFSKKDYFLALQYCNVALDITDNFIEDQERSLNKLGFTMEEAKPQIKFFQDQAYMHHLKGMIRIEQERYLDAEFEFRRSISLDGEVTQVYIDLAKLLALQGRFSDAKKELKYSISQDSTSSKAKTQLATLHYQLEEIDSAIYYYELVRNKKPNDKWPYYYLGSIYASDKNHQKAIEYFEAYLKIDSTSEEVFYRKAVEHIELAQWELALAEWNKVVAINPSNAEAWRNRGLTNFQLLAYDSAISDFSMALVLLPEQAYTQINRGYSYYLIGSPKKALSDIDQGLELVPKYYLGYYFRALVYRQLRKNRKSCNDLKTAISLGMKDEEIDKDLLSKCY